MNDRLLLTLEELIEELPTEAKHVCPVNGCKMPTGPQAAIFTGIYEGILYWQCPVCSGTWHRWPPHHPLRRFAAPFVGRE